LSPEFAVLEISLALDAIIASHCNELDREIVLMRKRIEKYRGIANNADRHSRPSRRKSRRDTALCEIAEAEATILELEFSKEAALSLMGEDQEGSIKRAVGHFRKHAENYIVGTPVAAEKSCVRLRPLAEQLMSLLRLSKSYPQDTISRARKLAEKARLEAMHV